MYDVRALFWAAMAFDYCFRFLIRVKVKFKRSN